MSLFYGLLVISLQGSLWGPSKWGEKGEGGMLGVMNTYKTVLVLCKRKLKTFLLQEFFPVSLLPSVIAVWSSWYKWFAQFCKATVTQVSLKMYNPWPVWPVSVQEAPTMYSKCHLNTCGDLTTISCWEVDIHFAGWKFTSESQVVQGAESICFWLLPVVLRRYFVCSQKQLKQKSILVPF